MGGGSEGSAGGGGGVSSAAAELARGALAPGALPGGCGTSSELLDFLEEFCRSIGGW